MELRWKLFEGLYNNGLDFGKYNIDVNSNV